ncbi:hypothetical protein ACFFTK_09335 [Pseudonocardia petroleophila]|uniref:Uncharacterized protein n=1 Tax=Pseudonocardia petroleophila TaxID=37331 RepID=A0A7G7MGV0_9PSEU|nr:hypothetical protein [Pseudonocardia petroleophila]QNG52011.1 hypothetical protein H6H00_28720 [Pseudonocardia petroleophila]
MDDAELSPPARVVVFLAALAVAAAAAWTVGGLSSELVPVPDLTRPAVLGGSGQDVPAVSSGAEDDGGGPGWVAPVHEGAHGR